MMRSAIGMAALALLAACSSADGEANAAAGAMAADATTAAAPGKSADASAEPAPAAKPAVTAATDARSLAGRIVDCAITTNGEDFSGPCRFLAERDGSFSLSLDDESPLVDEITIVSVSALAPGHADVSGLTTSGINSRWGEATRDRADRACWSGEDFRICAY